MLITDTNFNINEFNKDRKYKKAALFIGRFQPFTFAHELMARCINPEKVIVFCIVNGSTTSLQKSRNPFNFEYRKELIQEIFPGEIIIKSNDAYIPNIVLDIREKYNYEIDEVICGSDRIESYSRMVKNINELQIDDFENTDIKIREIHRTDEDISSTKVRKSLKSKDFNSFKSMMSYILYDKFDEMVEKIEKTNI